MNFRWLFASLPALSLANLCFAEAIDHWTQRDTRPVNCVRFCGGRFIAVGREGRILTSPDGEQWTPQVSGFGWPTEFYGVTFGQTAAGGFFVVVGDNGALVSQNATNWTQARGAGGLSDVTFNGTTFVAAGGRGVAYCTNAVPTNWVSIQIVSPDPSPFPFVNLSRIAYGNGQFVAVGDIWTGIWTSSDGISWKDRGQRGREYFYGVTHGNNRFLAVGVEGPSMVSTNGGISWTSSLVVPTNISDTCNLFVGRDATFVDGRFAVVGGCGLLTTTNGLIWERRQGGVNGWSIAFGAGTFVVGSPFGGIWQSDSVGGQSGSIAGALTTRLFTNTGPVELSVMIESNRTFAIQATTNFVQWSEIWRATSTGGTIQFLDWSVTNSVQRFYRTVTP